MKTSLVIAMVMLFGGLAYFEYLDGATEREWVPVREQLLRLDSGVEHEAKILLRTTIANSAAAVDIYSQGKEARLSEPRVIDAKRAIRHLELAMDDEALGEYIDWTPSLWEAFRLGEVNGDDLLIKCKSNGRVFVGGLHFAHLAAGKQYLALAIDLRAKSEIRPADFTSAQTACSEAWKHRQRSLGVGRR